MIRLTTLTRVLTQEAEKKLDEFESRRASAQEEQEDMWSRLGLPAPEDDSEVDFEEEPEFTEEDYEFITSYVMVDGDSIDLILKVRENASEVYLKTQKSFTAQGTPEEVYAEIRKEKSLIRRIINFVKVK